MTPSCVLQSKGYSPREEDVGIILAIHNAVNEEGEEEGGGKGPTRFYLS